MKTAQAASRSRIQNGTVAARRAPRNTRSAARLRIAVRQAVAPRSRPRKARRIADAPMPNGLSVMGLLVCACAVIVFMLVGALSWQRNAYALAQQEVALRSALDQSGDEHQQLLAEQSRALNPRETAMHSANSGLNEFKLDERTAMVALKPKKTATPDNKTKPKPANAKPASTR